MVGRGLRVELVELLPAPSGRISAAGSSGAREVCAAPGAPAAPEARAVGPRTRSRIAPRADRARVGSPASPDRRPHPCRQSCQPTTRTPHEPRRTPRSAPLAPRGSVMALREFRWLPHDGGRHAIPASLVVGDVAKTLCGRELAVPHDPPTKTQWC